VTEEHKGSVVSYVGKEEAMPFVQINVLDHGYVRRVESYGSDERIIEAARMSTQKGFLGWGDGVRAGDEKLLKYLRDNKHDTPFEMAGLIVEVQAPIFVFREWHRHRTQSYNEMSARYASLPDLNYVPTIDRIEMGGGQITKQAGSVVDWPKEEYPHENAMRFRDALSMEYDECERVYQASLGSGIPKELARLILPVGRYSRMRAAANLRNWLAFLVLRQSPKAQWEIRQYANAVHEILSGEFPKTMALFDEGRA
jgi:thymidylate synthase (FAD)